MIRKTGVYGCRMLVNDGATRRDECANFTRHLIDPACCRDRSPSKLLASTDTVDKGSSFSFVIYRRLHTTLLLIINKATMNSQNKGVDCQV
jgi:hypothetical protein